MNALLLHGAGGGAWEWQVWRGVFEAGGVRCETLEFEPVTGGLENTRLSDYVEQAEAAAARHGPLVVIGASLGGLIALQLAARTPCSALVLINPLPPAPEATTLPPHAAYPNIVPWRREANLAATRRAMPDADDLACLYAFRHWRDESGLVMNEARAGIDVAPPACPIIVMASDHDAEVPRTVSAALATRLSASLIQVAGSHLGAVLGRQAAACAQLALASLRVIAPTPATSSATR